MKFSNFTSSPTTISRAIENLDFVEIYNSYALWIKNNMWAWKSGSSPATQPFNLATRPNGLTAFATAHYNFVSKSNVQKFQRKCSKFLSEHPEVIKTKADIFSEMFPTLVQLKIKDKQQQKRNEELQYSMPPMAQQLNQAVIPEVANVYPPSSAVNRRRDDFGAPTNMAPSFQPLVGGGGYFSTQPTSVNSEQTMQRNSTVQRNSTMQQNIFNEGYQSSMPKLSSEDAREMLFGKRPDDKGKPVALSTPYLVNI
jgi:hypothetical protein